MSEDWRAEHRRVAAKVFGQRIPPGFSKEETLRLQRWGSWLEALWMGELRPRTQAQRRFVRASRCWIPAETSFELLWRRFVDSGGYDDDLIDDVQLIKDREEWEYHEDEDSAAEGSPFEFDDVLRDSGDLEEDTAASEDADDLHDASEYGSDEPA